MSILFDDTRVSTRPSGRSITGLWLSVGLHVLVVVVLIVAPIRASEKPSTPRMPSRMVFVLPAAQSVMLPPSAPVVAPRLPAPPAPPQPVRELARAEPPKPLPVVAKPIEPASAPIVPAIERPIERPVIQRPPEIGLFERTNAARTSQAADAVTTGGFGSAAGSARGVANGTGAVTTGGFGNSAPASRGAANRS